MRALIVMIYFFKLFLQKSSQDDLLRLFLLTMFNTSLNCFLFSYHVHEKSIMLPALAAILLTPWYPKETIWFITISSLSMYPLFNQEGSHLALLCVTGFFVLAAQQGKIITSQGMRSFFGYFEILIPFPDCFTCNEFLLRSFLITMFQSDVLGFTWRIRVPDLWSSFRHSTRETAPYISSRDCSVFIPSLCCL